MYRPLRYRKDDPEYIKSFIKKHPFATFVTKGANLLATHIPVLLEEDGSNWKLFGHIANHNDQIGNICDGEEALIIFSGVNGYISSSWYEEKDISTWDYTAVHVNAKIIKQSNQELENSLQKLVSNFEKNQESPLYYKEIPKQMREEHLPLITGFWLEPIKIQGVAKLHQSYQREDVKNSISHLENSGNPCDSELAKAIRKENNIE
ncbi:FMN-binding negative transcriptional regulator [Christiangramia aquimixticola]|uniref:FMN-binding negative transcriptional regulator n=1 Tax=Christiangramia aquimixticola TaxID=1697558 RepID=UPI003AA96C50